MSAFGIYFLDTSSFLTATAVYIDELLTTKAADGYYQQNSIVREQVSGLLQPQATCADCGEGCSFTVSVSGAASGFYSVDVDLGDLTGVFTVSLNPYNVPINMEVVFNSTTYTYTNAQSYISAVNGPIMGKYIGRTADDSGLVAGSPWSLTAYRYNGDSAAYEATGLLVTETIVAGDLDLSASSPGECVMVIQKPSPQPKVATVNIYAPLGSSQWDLTVSCAGAGLANAFSSNAAAQLSSVLACAQSNTNTWYRVAVGGSASAVGLNDIIYADSLGKTKLATYKGAGFYRFGSTQWLEIDANSLVQSFGSC